MNKQEYMDCEDKALLHTYNRFPLVLDHGEGVYLYDTDGKKYLDFAAGIAVEALGYSNEAYKQALKDQIDKITHTSNPVSYTHLDVYKRQMPVRCRGTVRKYCAILWKKGILNGI